MAYDFYVIEGKKLIDYKPTEEHYKRAFIRYCERLVKNPEIFTETKDKALFLMIKMIGRTKKKIKQMEEKEVYDLFQSMQIVNYIVGEHTPREFMKLFPIDKDYSGGDCWKDYFYCMDYINKFGIDNPIGDTATEFLMEYQNMDITSYVLAMMQVISAMSVLENGTDPFVGAMEEIGIHPRTMYQEGNEMVDSETGERFEIEKPRNPMRKLFSVV